MAGEPSGRFEPKRNVTYAEFATMLTQAFFPDVLRIYIGPRTPWYAPYSCVAQDAGLFWDTRALYDSYEKNDFVAGGAGANTPLTRYEMAMMMYNMFRYFRDRESKPWLMPTEAGSAAAAGTIADYAQVPELYRPAVSGMVSVGALSGMEDGSFRGSSLMTREQAAVVMLKLVDLLGGQR